MKYERAEYQVVAVDKKTGVEDTYKVTDNLSVAKSTAKKLKADRNLSRVRVFVMEELPS